MPSDLGDESGEKLFDYLLRLGQDAGEQAMCDAAERLAEALRNARGSVSESADRADGADLRGLDVEAGVGADAPAWAKLSMREFEGLPEYGSVREIIGAALDRAGVEHDFFADKDSREWLVFKVEDAPDVDEAFKGLEESTGKAYEKALQTRGLTREQVRDMEPLAKKVESARAASEVANDEKTREAVRNRTQSRSR